MMVTLSLRDILFSVKCVWCGVACVSNDIESRICVVVLFFCFFRLNFFFCHRKDDLSFMSAYVLVDDGLRRRRRLVSNVITVITVVVVVVVVVVIVETVHCTHCRHHR